ncbi:hypothetical protein CC1G_09603 [Coprinopsis cinerea okayama7|uniref:Uncharacterized protein n=1 Tax=Coprinopsis cinerea (strain Okayama-7 / 130 / ATCC MYA-4618 / FGSC 9003) TaxID=240176 RepID=A8N4B9_COPC7|nr:hypothetical protein CC1G_09603 [Coprinopsis cinerea okayama7\|eukprot:XP_001829714.2 hypothetical protein CC1G_09603 [Coprinopsis cinerea okayama7\
MNGFDDVGFRRVLDVFIHPPFLFFITSFSVGVVLSLACSRERGEEEGRRSRRTGGAGGREEEGREEGRTGGAGQEGREYDSKPSTHDSFGTQDLVSPQDTARVGIQRTSGHSHRRRQHNRHQHTCHIADPSIPSPQRNTFSNVRTVSSGFRVARGLLLCTFVVALLVVGARRVPGVDGRMGSRHPGGWRVRASVCRSSKVGPNVARRSAMRAFTFDRLDVGSPRSTFVFRPFTDDARLLTSHVRPLAPGIKLALRMVCGPPRLQPATDERHSMFPADEGRSMGFRPHLAFLHFGRHLGFAIFMLAFSLSVFSR